jgi:hypothetical protein
MDFSPDYQKNPLLSHLMNVVSKSIVISKNIYPFSFSLFRPREERDFEIWQHW